MKTVSIEVIHNYHPEVVEEYFIHPEMIDYLVEHHPFMEKIKVLESRRDETESFYKLKYILALPIPAAIKKLINAASDELTTGVTVEMNVDKEALKIDVQITPEFMVDKVESSSVSTFSEKGDKWAQKIDVSIDINAFGVGGIIEKYAVGVAKELMQTTFELIDEFLSKKLTP